MGQQPEDDPHGTDELDIGLLGTRLDANAARFEALKTAQAVPAQPEIISILKLSSTDSSARHLIDKGNVTGFNTLRRKFPFWTPDLSGLPLAGRRLAHVNLKNMRFTNTDFSGTDFSHADLSGTTFNESNLQRVNFGNARLLRTDFLASDLSGANFLDAIVFCAMFPHADLRGTNITPEQLCRSTFMNAKFDNPELAEAALRLIAKSLRE